MTRLPIAVVVIVVLAGALIAGPARAADSADKLDKKAMSVALFEEARHLAAQGDYANACAKFEASQQLVAGLGTELNLADCYEHLGKTATAWVTFRNASVDAARSGDAREEFARQRMAALEPKLSYLIIKLAPGADVPGLEISRNNLTVDRQLVDVKVPLDPGSYNIDAGASDRKPYHLTIDVTAGATVTVEIPPLPPAPSTGKTMRYAAYGAGAVGVVGVAVGTIMALSARSQLSDAKSSGHCTDALVCDPSGIDMVNSAHSKANLATGAFVVGGAAIAGAVVLYLLAPKASYHFEVTPSVGNGDVGMVVSGAF